VVKDVVTECRQDSTTYRVQHGIEKDAWDKWAESREILELQTGP
jgi:hypothetical protein